MRSSPPKNIYWELTKAGEPCPYCGRLHDEAGRQLDERGKLMVQPARQDGDVKFVKPCPRSSLKQAQIRNAPPLKVNRMLGTERERLSRVGK
jgi:hypothetical protein